jgi:NADH:ubiquinone oxidoreductase subunit F (NADH-binding)
MSTLDRGEHVLHGADSPPAGRLPRLLPARLAGGPASLMEHLARYGPPPAGGGGGPWRERLIAEVARSGLTGRGGAGFPTVRKLRAVAAGRDVPMVIANGTEGEPASAKDKVLLAREPHLVLDGAVLAAHMAGATQVIVVVHEAVHELVAAAATERRHARADSVKLKVMTGADRFVGGEASALVNWVAHGIPLPTATPPRTSESGLHGRPTLVCNVETLAHVALIARHGARWFRSLGTPSEPGSMLVTLTGAVNRPGVYEIGIGTPVHDVLDLAGGPAGPLGALLLGGYFGTWADPAVAGPLPFSAAGLSAVGASPGAGLVAALPHDCCGLAETARVTRYLAGESAGQCGPCVFGLDAIAGALDALAGGRYFQPGRVQRWLTQAEGRGACHHPDGAVRMVRSALKVFGAEIDRHAEGWCCGRRPTGVLPVPPRAGANPGGGPGPPIAYGPVPWSPGASGMSRGQRDDW